MIGDCNKPLSLLRFSENHPCAERDTGVTFVYIGGTSPPGGTPMGGNQHDIKKEEVGSSSRCRSRGVGNGDHHPGRRRQASRIEDRR